MIGDRYICELGCEDIKVHNLLNLPISTNTFYFPVKKRVFSNDFFFEFLISLIL